jgi:hypothetical protein
VPRDEIHQNNVTARSLNLGAADHFLDPVIGAFH